MRRLLILLVLTVAAASSTRGADIYFANAATGSNNGSSCGNARALSSHAAGDDVSGNILHLCSTITGAANSTIFTPFASGSSGNPITLKWETGAILQAPYFQGNGTVPACALNFSNRSFWVIDGGTNGIIQNTANGTSLANQRDTCFINANGTNQVTIRNLTLANAYVHLRMQNVSASGNGTTVTLTSSLPGCGMTVAQGGMTVSNNGATGSFIGTGLTVTPGSGNTCTYPSSATGSASGLLLSDTKGGSSYGIFFQNAKNLTIDRNVFHDIRWQAFLLYTGTNNLANITITNNEFYNGDHGVGGGDNASNSTADNILVQYNYFHDYTNWDALCGTNSNPDVMNVCFHRDFVHVWAEPNANTHTTNFVIDKNLFVSPFTMGTGWVNLESGQGIGSYHNGAWVTNNVFQNTDTADGVIAIPPYCYISTGGQNEVVANNTVLGASSSQAVSNCLLYMGSASLNMRAINNIGSQLGYGLVATQSAPNWTTINTNYYYKHNGQMNYTGGGGIISFAAWQGSGADANSVSSGTVAPQIQTTLPFAPLSPNNVGFGTNLTSLCATHAQLCTSLTFNGNRPTQGAARPGSGNWLLGAVQSTSSVIPPSPPTGLSASVAGSTVTLSATPSSGAPIPTGYSLYRGTVHGGPYTLIKSALSSPSTTDTPANGTYFYTMTAFVGGLVSTISGNGTTATVTCMTACPSFPNGTTFTIFGDSLAAFNGTFTSTGQPTASTFTFSSSTNSVGSGGAAWPTSQESVKSNEAQATVPAALTVTLLPASRTFASQTVGTPSATQPVTLTNTSGPGQSVTISSKSITGANSGDFSQTNNCPASLSSGSSCTFQVTFTPTAAGARTATLTVVDNATGSPHTVTLNGTGVAATPAVTLTPAAIVFGDQLTGTTSVAVPVTLQNTGTGTLSISSISATGDFGQSNGCGATLGVGLSCTINVTFSPTLTGTRTGSIQVTDNASGSPHQVSLTGTGITTKCAITGLVTLDGAAGVCQ